MANRRIFTLAHAKRSCTEGKKNIPRFSIPACGLVPLHYRLTPPPPCPHSHLRPDPSAPIHYLSLHQCVDPTSLESLCERPKPLVSLSTVLFFLSFLSRGDFPQRDLTHKVRMDAWVAWVSRIHGETACKRFNNTNDTLKLEFHLCEQC